MLAYILALVVGFGSLGIYLAAFFLPEIHRKTDFYWSGVGLFYALMLWVCAGRITGGVLLGQIAGVALLGWFGWQTLTLRWQLIPPEQQTELASSGAAAETLKAQAGSLKENLQSKLSNLTLPEGASQIPEKVIGLFTNVKEKIQGTLGGINKPKKQPTGKTKSPKATPLTMLPKEALEPDSEADAIAGSSPIPGAISSEKSTPTRPSPFEAIAAKEAESTPSESAAAAESGEPEPIRPNPPSPELVEEAVEDAQAKHLPSTPPPTIEPENPS